MMGGITIQKMDGDTGALGVIMEFKVTDDEHLKPSPAVATALYFPPSPGVFRPPNAVEIPFPGSVEVSTLEIMNNQTGKWVLVQELGITRFVRNTIIAALKDYQAERGEELRYE